MNENIASHGDAVGSGRKVDLVERSDTERRASARGEVSLSASTVILIRDRLIKKGDVLMVAQIAGIQAAKRTADLIPLCKGVNLQQIEIHLEVDMLLPGIQISAVIRSFEKTGIEMEALTAVSVAALTVFDMVKSVEKGARIQNIRLVEPYSGRSGDVIGE